MQHPRGRNPRFPGQPNLTVTAAQGGSITSSHIFPATGSPRTGQLNLRWNF